MNWEYIKETINSRMKWKSLESCRVQKNNIWFPRRKLQTNLLPKIDHLRWQFMSIQHELTSTLWFQISYSKYLGWVNLKYCPRLGWLDLNRLTYCPRLVWINLNESIPQLNILSFILETTCLKYNLVVLIT